MTASSIPERPPVIKPLDNRSKNPVTINPNRFKSEKSTFREKAIAPGYSVLQFPISPGQA